MKKNVLIGIFSPLFYHLAVNIMHYTIFAYEYSEKYAILYNVLFYTLPALPGIALIFLLIRNSLEEFFESLGTCFLISLIVFLLYHFSGVDSMIHTKVVGYEEFSLGDGLLYVITMICYLSSCLVGSIIAGVATYVRKRKKARIIQKQGTQRR